MLWLGLPESVRFLIEKRPDDKRIAAIVSRLAPGVDPRNVTLAARSGVKRQSVFSLLAPVYRPRTLLLWVGVALNMFSLYFLISWLPALLNSAGWSPADASRGGVMLQIGGIISGLILAWYVDRGRTVPAMVTAYLVTAASFGLFLILPPDSGFWWLLLLAIGAGTSGTQFAFNALSAAFYPSLIRSTGVGWAVGVGRIGAILGPAFGGFIVSAQLATPYVLGLLIIPVLLCAVSVMFLPRVWRETEQPTASLLDDLVSSSIRGKPPWPCLPEHEQQRRTVASLSIGIAMIFSAPPTSAQGVVMQRNLSLPMAKTIAEATLAECKSKGFNTAAAVVDRAGQVLVLLRDEQATAQQAEMARRKAYTARMFRISTMEFQKRSAGDSLTAAQRDLADILALSGGVPIQVGNDTIGAVGSAGSSLETDDACAKAGIAKVADLLK